MAKIRQSLIFILLSACFRLTQTKKFIATTHFLYLLSVIAVICAIDRYFALQDLERFPLHTHTKIKLLIAINIIASDSSRSFMNYNALELQPPKLSQFKCEGTQGLFSPLDPKKKKKNRCLCQCHPMFLFSATFAFKLFLRVFGFILRGLPLPQNEGCYLPLCSYC